MLPIEDILPSLLATLAHSNAAVLVAPPGAGKTTMVPLACLDQAWTVGRQILILEPRRLAARAAATRMAHMLGESVGQTVGLRVRLQTLVSPSTRIEVITEGVFTRMILDDPALEGVGMVVFDEFHERSLDADLSFALARDSQLVLRDDLRLLVMSATLDVEGLSKHLDNAPILESLGRQFDVQTRYLGRNPSLSLEEQVARAVRMAVAEETGSILVFLPGQGEIHRVHALLTERGLPAGTRVQKLYGALSVAEQDLAVRPAAEGERKIVLTTSIAETSLTIEGIRVVVDSGLSRTPKFDPASGLTRLTTSRVVLSSADQRRGRAGRTAPGVCYRLWDEAETRSLVPFSRPEILDSDLSRLSLDLLTWGAQSTDDLVFLDHPPKPAMHEARRLLERLGAVDTKGGLTPHGRAMSLLPVPPRLGHMMLMAHRAGQPGLGCDLATLLTEPGLGGREIDLVLRLDFWGRDRSQRAGDARALSRRLRASLAKAGATASDGHISLGALLSEAWPERVAQRRGAPGHFVLASGRGVQMEPTDPLARGEPWIVVAELGSGARTDRILSAAALSLDDLLSQFAGRLQQQSRLEPAPSGRLRLRERLVLDRLVLQERWNDAPDPALVLAALLDQVRRQGLQVLPFPERSRALRQRVEFWCRLNGDQPNGLTDESLLTEVDIWLAPILIGLQKLDDVCPDQLHQALLDRLGWQNQTRIEQDLPSHWMAPTGSRLSIDYEAEGGPTISVRVQELFGLGEHPSVTAGKVPLTLCLLSPAHRPIQVTRDLPGFWGGSWKAVRSEMKGRYPRHVWPENPAVTAPTTKAKPRGT